MGNMISTKTDSLVVKATPSTTPPFTFDSLSCENKSMESDNKSGGSEATEVTVTSSLEMYTSVDAAMPLVDNEILIIDHCVSHPQDQREEMRQREAQNMVNPSSTVRKQSLNLPSRIQEVCLD